MLFLGKDLLGYLGQQTVKFPIIVDQCYCKVVFS